MGLDDNVTITPIDCLHCDDWSCVVDKDHLLFIKLLVLLIELSGSLVFKNKRFHTYLLRLRGESDTLNLVAGIQFYLSVFPYAVILQLFQAILSHGSQPVQMKWFFLSVVSLSLRVGWLTASDYSLCSIATLFDYDWTPFYHTANIFA